MKRTSFNKKVGQAAKPDHLDSVEPEIKLSDPSPAVGELPSKVTNNLPKGIKSIEGDKATINLDFLRDIKLFIATPCYGGLVTDQYFLSIFKLAQTLMKFGIEFRISTLRNESLIPRARNILTAMFLEDKSMTHLLWVDADIEFEPESVIRMLCLDKELIAGAYPKKTIDWEQVRRAALAGEEDLAKYGAQYAINMKINNGQVRVDNGAIEVLDASTGFMLIKREVFDKMIEAYPELKYNNDSSIDPKFNDYCYALFDTGIDEVDARYLSEDYLFVRRWQKLGGEVWIDIHTDLNHIGSYSFVGKVSSLFKGV